MQELRLLSYNVQVGIRTQRYREYLTKSWRHLVPHSGRLENLARTAQLLHGFDLVGLQEVDAGSLRSGFVDLTEYLAFHARFPFWYRQVNRNLGTLARHSNGVLSRIRPHRLVEHRLPGLPGRGALVLEFATSDGRGLEVWILHLALGARARRRQLDYIGALVTRSRYLVLMGDFNCDCRSAPLRALVTQVDLHGLDCGLKTFPSWQPKHTLDHILVSRTLRVLDVEVLGYHLSDHLPVSMRVALPPGVRVLSDGWAESHLGFQSAR